MSERAVGSAIDVYSTQVADPIAQQLAAQSGLSTHRSDAASAAPIAAIRCTSEIPT